MSGAKMGLSFVIPKNKLSGALVPVVRNVGSKCEVVIDVNSKEEGEDSKSLVSQRKTKWGLDLTQDPAVKRGRALALQTRAEQIAAQLESGKLDTDTSGSRIPSPPPVYDSNGQRTNTREGRRREQLELERREAIGDCMQLNPLFKPPSGYKPVYKEAKLYIPVKDYPGYNFIGLILGPRGNTQKRMEAETGSRIAIRGKGAVKEGKSNAMHLQGGRRDSKEAEGAFDDLHVHITADSVEKVDAAVALLEPLLSPLDEDRNTHKRKQLRELAEMNGTVRDCPKTCGICGETSHRDWHCPKDKLITFQAKVECRICGDGGHPTIDCPRKDNTGQGKALDKEYLSFLEELGNELARPTAAVKDGHVVQKLGGEDLSRPQSQPGSKRTRNRCDDAGIMALVSTSPDPNQLVAVMSKPHQNVIPLSNSRHMKAAWPPDNVSLQNCEDRIGLPYGGQPQPQAVADSHFPGIFQVYPSQFQCNMTSGNFTHPQILTPPDPSFYQARVPSGMNLNPGGLHVPQDFQVRPQSVPASRTPCYGNAQTGDGSFPDYDGADLGRPCQMQVPTALAETSSCPQTYPIGQSASNQAAGVTSTPEVWKSNQHFQAPGNWKTVPPRSAWQMNCEPNWNQEHHPMPATSLSRSGPGEAAQKPWETIPLWNTWNLPAEVSQPWNSNQQNPPPFHPYVPKPGSGHFVWMDGPAPRSLSRSAPLHDSFLPPPLAEFVSYQPYPTHLEYWQSHRKTVPEVKRPLINPAPSCCTQSKGTSLPDPPASGLPVYAPDQQSTINSPNVGSDGGQMRALNT
ncbi:hypothetical protein R1sor_017783 [Riccia sorocarpa]|uniref:K Homology domain-containing protein n=1 Tax=Riccia sorocarpa TaxID=122646 RepID=A0ABD3IBU8_9MARC